VERSPTPICLVDASGIAGANVALQATLSVKYPPARQTRRELPFEHYRGDRSRPEKAARRSP